MGHSALSTIAFISLNLMFVPSGFAARRPSPDDAGGVLRGLSVASFPGSTQDSIQAVATDPEGNIFVVGTTYSVNFPVQNAFQPTFGDATILRTLDLGATWNRVGSPPDAPAVVVPDPVLAQLLFAGSNS